jgi:hypothetical protein
MAQQLTNHTCKPGKPSYHFEFLILNHITQGLFANYIVIDGLKAYHFHRKYQDFLVLESKVGD